MCSAEADGRGSGQDVVAYSLFGSSNQSATIRQRYFNNLQHRVARVAQLYPGNNQQRHYFSIELRMN